MMNGIKYYLYSYIPDNQLGEIKLDIFDYGIIEEKTKINPEKVIENFEKEVTSNTRYKTMKFLAANDKWFLNDIDWKESKSIETLEK